MDLCFWDLFLPLIMSSGWRQATFVSNEDIPSSAELILAHFSCDQSEGLILSSLESTYPRDDYVNVVIYCDKNTTLRITQSLWREVSDKGHRYNLLVVSSTEQYPVPFPLRDGDNVGFVLYKTPGMECRQIVSKPGLTLSQLYRRPVWNETSLTLSWCMGTCKQTGYHRNAVVTSIQHTRFAMLPAIFAGFQGRNFKITVYRGSVYVKRTRLRNGTFYFHGVLMNIFNVLKEKFDFRIQNIEETRSYGRPINRNRTIFNGAVGKIQRGDTEAFLAGSSITFEREQVIDFLYPVRYDYSVFVMRIPFRKSEYLISPLSVRVWALIASLPVGIAVILAIFERGYKQNCKLCVYDLLSAFKMMMGQGVPRKFRWMASYLLVSAYILSLVIIIGTYVGNLTASLAVSKPVFPFNSIDELAENNDYPVIVKPSSSQRSFLQASKSPALQKIWTFIQQDPLFDTKEYKYRVGYIHQNSRVGFVSQLSMQRFRNLDVSYCNLVAIPGKLDQSSLGIMIREGVPYKRHFDLVIMQLHEAGLIQKWFLEYEPRVICNNAQLSVDALKLEDAMYVFMYLLGVPLSFAALAFLLEWVVWLAGKHNIFSPEGKLRQPFKTEIDFDVLG